MVCPRIALTAALAICLGAWGSAGPISAQEVFDEFEDDFSLDDGFPAGWTVNSGAWEIFEERLFIPAGGEHTIWLGEPPGFTLDEFVVRFTIDWPNWDGAALRHGGALFFSDGATQRFAANCYTVDWVDGGGVRTFRWQSPGAPQFQSLAPDVPLGQPPREWKIVVQGDSIRVFGDGQLLQDIVDTTYREGHFGLWNHGMTDMAIDDFAITEPDCEADDDGQDGVEDNCEDGVDNDCDDSVDGDDLDCCLAEEPGFEFTCDDDVDNDCDGLKDDNDPDCCVPDADGEDGVEDTCDDGIDNDCDQTIDRADTDCCLQIETFCADGEDDDCDGLIDDDDFDCCVFEGATEEICDDGFDNDCDEKTDCDDRDCVGTEACPIETDCDNGDDEDEDFLIDCEDDDCQNKPPCAVLEFSDNFDDDELDNWTISSGIWEVVDGALVTEIGGSEHHVWMGDPPAFLPENFTITFDLEFTDWDGDMSVGRHGGTVVFAQSPSTRFNGNNYTIDWIDRPDDHGIRVFRDLAVALAFGTPEPFDPPMTWTIEFDGAFISVFADNDFLVGQWEDQEHRVGHFGFWNQGPHSGLKIDNFSLRQLCEPVGDTEENCDDGIDNDCDGTADAADTDCAPPGIGPILRGDCDGNGTVGGSPTEAIVLLNFAFRGADAPGCLAACDAEANGAIGVTDALRILRFAFLGIGSPDAPFPECVTSTLESDMALGCETPNDCP